MMKFIYFSHFIYNTNAGRISIPLLNWFNIRTLVQ
jgi:hypothetical protein